MRNILLAALDAFYAAGRIDCVLRAAYYATLLPGFANADSRTVDVEVRFQDGNILLRYYARALVALTVGTLSPILPLAHANCP